MRVSAFIRARLVLRPRICACKPHSGFTLIELLVAMFLLAILGTAGFQMLTQINATRVAIESQADRLAQLQRTFYWLAEDVTQIVDRPVRSSVDEPLPAFQVNLAGGSLFDLTRAGWINPVANVLPPRSDLQRVSWSLEGDALLRSYWYHLDPVDETPSKRRQLLDRVGDLRLRYLDASGSWSDNWPPLSTQGLEDAPALPRAIEFVFELEDLGDVRRVFALPS